MQSTNIINHNFVEDPLKEADPDLIWPQIRPSLDVEL